MCFLKVKKSVQKVGVHPNFLNTYTLYRIVPLNIMSAFAAYSFFPKKPSIKKDIEETNPSVIDQLNQQKLNAA